MFPAPGAIFDFPWTAFSRALLGRRSAARVQALPFHVIARRRSRRGNPIANVILPEIAKGAQRPHNDKTIVF